MTLAIVIIWLLAAILVGVLADRRGRCGVCFALLSLALSPLIGLLVVFIVPPNTEVAEARALADGATRKCPYCAELIKRDATICRYCGKSQTGGEREAVITDEAIERLAARLKAKP